MPVNPTIPVRFLDRDGDVLVNKRENLPHWGQAGTLCFITWRTWDSMPRAVVESWERERNEWLTGHGINSKEIEWQMHLEALSSPAKQDYRKRIIASWENRLDECHGECVLRRPELARIVENALRFFDGRRYLITDFVVMPNHVHVLASFGSDNEMVKQCASWKHFTARQINRELGRHGRFWQVDSFDHLVRGPEQFVKFRNYIANNPKYARLSSGEFIHYSKSDLIISDW